MNRLLVQKFFFSELVESKRRYRQLRMNQSLARGFTLIEAIISIVIMGIIAVLISSFIKAPVDSYMDTVRRANLTDAADGALRRVARDVRAALSNSLRSISNDPNNTSCIEFLPVVASGRYRNTFAVPSDPPETTDIPGNVFNFTTTGPFSFDALANNNLDRLPEGTNHVVVYNIGVSDSDAYVGSNRRSITSLKLSGISPILKVTGVKFPFESPGKRFQVIPNYSVVYSCDLDAGQLLRSTRQFSNTEPFSLDPLVDCPVAGSSGSPSVLVNKVTSCDFTYIPAANQRNGLLTLQLELTQSDETIQLYQEIHVNNLP